MPLALHGRPKTGTTGFARRNQSQPNQFGDSEELSPALDTSRRELAAALQHNVDLLRHCSVLTEKVSSLDSALGKANQLAHYDALTGLPNRRLLLDRFIQAAALANRNRHFLALLFFDVNNFKHVNDKLGHGAGDQLLRQLAARLSSSIRKSDTACRYGGDEFIILLTEVNDHQQVVKAMQKIRAKLASTYAIDRHTIRLTVSDGLSIYPRDAQCFTDLMKLADRSMFSNKSNNKCLCVDVPTSNIWLHDAGNAPKLAF